MRDAVPDPSTVDLSNLQTTLASAGGTLTEVAPGQWQLESEHSRLLVLTNPERDWLRMMVPIAPEQEALPFAKELLQASFDRTRETRFALQEGVLWGMYQHRLSTVTGDDLLAALQQLETLRAGGLQTAFDDLIETKMRQIVAVLSEQGKSLEDAFQTLERLYEEGVLGSMQASREDRDSMLQAWRAKLSRIWQETNPPN